MKDLVSSHVHSSWEPIFKPIGSSFNEIIAQIDPHTVAPPVDKILRAFAGDLAECRCVIIGQDPYPTLGVATGLAFSADASVKRIPASLRNILIELGNDLQVEIPHHGDLNRWTHSGVLLLNRILTTRVGESGAHLDMGWQKITDHIAKELGERDVVAVLWGKHAQQLAPFFNLRVEGVHPSPLSAYRGFFGSRPFSKVNELLLKTGRSPIDWSL